MKGPDITWMVIIFAIISFNSCKENNSNSCKENISQSKNDTISSSEIKTDNYKSINREDEIKKFVYQTYYNSELLDTLYYMSEPSYSYGMLVKFLKNGITEELDYPVNENLSNENWHYREFYSDDFNKTLQDLCDLDRKVEDIIGFDWDIFECSQEGFFNLNVDVKNIILKSSTEAKVTLLQNNSERIFYLVKEHGVWKIDNMDNLKEDAKKIIREYKDYR